MSHPKNRRERFIVGEKLGKKRAKGYWVGCSGITQENMKRAAYLRRDTTKLCSCMMCKKWSEKKESQYKWQGYMKQEEKNGLGSGFSWGDR